MGGGEGTTAKASAKTAAGIFRYITVIQAINKATFILHQIEITRQIISPSSLSLHKATSPVGQLPKPIK